MDVNEKLAPNFTFGEMTNTGQTSLLTKNRQEALQFINAGKALAEMLQVVRDHFKKPVTIHSAFRGPSVNTAVGGSKTSQHMKFEACDFHVEGFTLQQVFDWIRKESGLKYGQVILEGRQPGKPTWIHLSLGEPWRDAKNCRQQMTFDGSKYTNVA
jgi:hypothetical protein